MSSGKEPIKGGELAKGGLLGTNHWKPISSNDIRQETVEEGGGTRTSRCAAAEVGTTTFDKHQRRRPRYGYSISRMKLTSDVFPQIL